MNKGGQMWGFDLMMATVIFIVAIIIFYLYTLNASEEAKANIDRLSYEGDIIADALLLEGTPKNWTNETVISPGILSKSIVNQTKLELFYNLSRYDYNKTKLLLNTKYDYYIYLSESMILNGEQVSGIGKAPTNQKNLIKIERITVYKDKPIKLIIEVWE